MGPLYDNSSSIIWVKFNFDNRDLKCFVWHLHWAQSRNLAFSKDSPCFHLYQWIWCLFFYSTSPLSHIAEVTITIVMTICMVTYHQTHDGVHQQNHKGEHYQTHDGDCNQTHDGNHRQTHDGDHSQTHNGDHFQETCCPRRRSWCWSTLPIRWSYLLP